VACASRALEYLYGVDPDLLPSSPEAVIPFPYGFRVVEVGRREWFSRGGSYIYFVRRVGMSSSAAASTLARLSGCSSPGLAGLKDACSVAYQYVSVRCSRRPPELVEAFRLKAWLAGRGVRLSPGNHGGNMFRVYFESSSADSVCSRLEGLSHAPGFYGPQRFGVERPNSHIYALHALKGDLGGLVSEAVYRYPSETRTCPGWYEARLVSEPWLHARIVPRVVLEALQSYLFNAALSEALRRGLSPWSLAEAGTTLPCPGRGEVRVPAARLPHERLTRSRSVWAKLVSRAAEEAGIPLEMLTYEAGLRPALRPLAYPVCRCKCRRGGPWDGVASISLPPGAYATIVFRAAAAVDWEESYSQCSP
jgi:tRNA pseudouridine13 synthase